MGGTRVGVGFGGGIRGRVGVVTGNAVYATHVAPGFTFGVGFTLILAPLKRSPWSMSDGASGIVALGLAPRR